jgi:hypothetical protein
MKRYGRKLDHKTLEEIRRMAVERVPLSGCARSRPRPPRVEVGDLLFRAGVPSDSALLRRYQLYTRVKAAVSLPMGPERVVALQAAKIGDRKKH